MSVPGSLINFANGPLSVEDRSCDRDDQLALCKDFSVQ